MNAQPTSLDALRRLPEYGAQRRNVFQSESALQWFVRRHRSELVSAGALTMLSRQWYADPARFDEFILKAGAAAARRASISMVLDKEARSATS